jgi:hypothetical protein
MARQRFQLRRDTATAWAAVNPILLAGEAGVELETGKLKVGDGIRNWNELSYSGAEEAGGLPSGGVQGNVLIKKTSANFDAEWVSSLDGGTFN